LKASTCSEYESYDISKRCYKSCLNPFLKNCENIVYKAGCMCKSGYVLDSKETCVPYTKCGCKSHDGSQIITVIQFYNNPYILDNNSYLKRSEIVIIINFALKTIIVILPIQI
jgi:hypothetical protein